MKIKLTIKSRWTTIWGGDFGCNFGSYPGASEILPEHINMGWPSSVSGHWKGAWHASKRRCWSHSGISTIIHLNITTTITCTAMTSTCTTVTTAGITMTGTSTTVTTIQGLLWFPSFSDKWTDFTNEETIMRGRRKVLYTWGSLYSASAILF